VTGRRRPGRDRGQFTAELAAGLPALLLLLLAGLTAVLAVSTRLQCLDAAREAALAGARGAPAGAAAAREAPPGAIVHIAMTTDTVTAEVTAAVPLLGAHLPHLTVHAAAVAAREPDQAGTTP
jgi:hypothetical protein